MRLRKELARRRARSWGDDDPVASRSSGRVARGAVGGDDASDPGAAWPGRAAAEEASEVVVARFEAAAPNEWWQIDAMDWVDRDRGGARCSTSSMTTRGCWSRPGPWPKRPASEAWTTFSQAASGGGCRPGCCRTTGCASPASSAASRCCSKRNLRDVGVRPITGRPYHPQTTGKVERFQQTLKKWLRRQPLAADLAELQAQLDEFCRIYNYERPHQGIGRVTPISRWHATPARTTRRPPPRPPRLADPPPPQASSTTHGIVYARAATRSTSASNGPANQPPSSSTTPRQRVHHRPTRPPPQARPHPPLPALRPTTEADHDDPATSVLTVTHVPRHTCHPCCATEQRHG